MAAGLAHGIGCPRARQLILEALHPGRALLSQATVQQMCAQDWDEFSGLVRMHRLGPMLHVSLAAAVPQPVKAQLHAAYRKHALRSLAIYRELVSVTRLLEAENISSIALKGAYLARFAYPEPGMRPMRDLDLLLRPEQAVRAFELLKAHGYRSAFDGLPEAYFADRIHLPPLTGPGGVNLELHHRLTAPDSGTDDFESALWQRAIVKMIASDKVQFLRPEDLLLHLCIHATLDHRLDLGPLALVDVALLVGAGQIDWPDFLQVVHSGGWQRCALPLLYLARRHMGAQIPEEVLDALGRQGEQAAWVQSAEYLLFSDPDDHRLLDYNVQEILYAGKFSERISKLVGAIFPPRATIARHFPVSADSPLAYLYYPRRWYRLFTGKLPALLNARSGRKGALRQLAMHRSVLSGWLQGRTM